MELTPGKVAVVTGAASGIGLALCERFACSGLNIVLADVEEAALADASEKIAALGVETLAVPTDVSDVASVEALSAATIDRFGSVHVVCNNAGVAGRAEPWAGPLSAWEWVVGVNLWGVVHGIRTFLPHLATGGGHIVNTASIAGLIPGFGGAYDASKHAVVAISEDLYLEMNEAGLPVGVSVLCPGWVRTNILDAQRNWPDRLGERPADNPTMAVMEHHVRRALDEGLTPAAVADQVASAVAEDRFWVIIGDEFLDLAVQRWHRIADRLDPVPVEETPGLPPRSQILEELAEALGMSPDTSG
jgi:NAD(P)-dependent dehydrogenase (short-subunit alcohol dehydrogenase family)